MRDVEQLRCADQLGRFDRVALELLDTAFNRAAVLARDFETSIDFDGVDGHFAWDKCNLVKSISDACFSISANPLRSSDCGLVCRNVYYLSVCFVRA